MIKTELWTFAIRYTVDQWNNTPKPEFNLQTQNEIFAEIKNINK